MTDFSLCKARVALFGCCFFLVSQACYAHFPWLAIDESGHALLFFSESPAERDYRLPESVSKAVVTALDGDKQSQQLKLEAPEIKGFAGRRSTKPVGDKVALQTSFQYGIYHGTLLNYYAKHLPPIGTKPIGASQDQRLALDATIEKTKPGMELTVTWKGKPVEGATVTIIDSEGETADEKTDEQGKASFSTGASGLTGFVIGHTIKAAGKWEGESYTSESHYCTLTAEYKSMTPGKKSGGSKKKERPVLEQADQASRYAPLPEALASFGAAVCDGWLYVYSGHIGKAHDHSRDNLSQSFRRLRLDRQGAWELLPMQTPLQGLPLVSHNGKLFRVGGLHATNAAGEDDQLQSVDEFACFDPATRQWTSLPNLPAGRSSHDAVVVGDKIYVVGGWTLDGDSEGEWLDQPLEYDLSATNGTWKPLPASPFRRRALAAAHWQGKLIVLGGMDEFHDISRSVDCLDPATGEWSKLVDFPGEGMSGFGISAWNTAGQLYASASEGIVYRLDDDGQRWTRIAELDRPRFFHRLLARDDSELLIIGGAPLDSEGHLADIESVGL